MTGRPTRTPALILLEVSPRSAKLLVGASPRAVQRAHVTTVADETDDPVAALRALAASHPISGKEVGLILGRELFSLRTLELPSVQAKELASMLELQLGKLTPYPRADILFAWQAVGTFREGYTTVLLGIARKAIVQQLLQFLKTKAVVPAWVGVSTEGLEAWWQTLGKPLAGGAPEHAPLTVVINVDFSSTDCAIVSAEGRMVFTHSVTAGHQQLTSAEQAKLRWMADLVRLPRILQHEEVKGQIGRAVVTGVTAGLDPLVEQLSTQWGVPVDVVDPWRGITLPPAAQQATAAAHVSPAALAGTLAAGRAPAIDLMPHEMRVAQALDVRSRHLARLAGTLAAIVVLLVALYFERIVVMQRYISDLRGRLAAVEPVAQDVTARRAAMTRVRGWLNPMAAPLEVLRALAAASDAEVTILQVSFQAGTPVTVRGKAASIGAAFAFFDRLKRQGVFANVQTRSVGKSKGAQETGAEFEIVCEMSAS